MPAPQEIIIGPFEVYIAAVGTTFPAINATPSGSWLKMGNNDMEEQGVTVTHTQTLAEWRGVGSTGPRKVARTSEACEIMFILVDLTLEKYLYAINGATINVTVGPPHTKDINLYQGTTVNMFALLARGLSPYLDGANAQYQVPVVYQKDNPKPVFSKAKPGGLQLTFAAMEDPNAASTSLRFGKLLIQDQ